MGETVAGYLLDFCIPRGSLHIGNINFKELQRNILPCQNEKKKKNLTDTSV